MTKIYILLITVITFSTGQNLRIINDDNFFKQKTVYTNNQKITTKKIKKDFKEIKKRTKENKYLLEKNIEIKQLQLKLIELTQKVMRLQKYSEYLLTELQNKTRKINLINKTK